MRGLLWWAGVVALVAQTEMRIGVPEAARARAMKQNSHKMQCSLRLDREVYLAGETARVRLTVTNPTHELIEVFNPFQTENAWINLYGPTEAKPDDPPSAPRWRVLNSHVPYGWQGLRFYDDQMTSLIKTSWFQPGESRTFEFESSEEWFGASMSPWGNGGNTRRPGRYQIRYTYCDQTAAEFEVVRPTLQVFVEQAISTPQPAKRGNLPEEPVVLGAFLFSVGERYYVAAGLREHYGSRLDRLTGQPMREGDMGSVIPFRRLAELNAPVRGLALRPVDRTTYEVVWTEAAGRVERRSFTPITNRR